jgi:ribosome-binding protein aMBF1 (putative translation factor)
VIVRHSRENRGWSVEDLASKAGVTTTAVNEAETNPLTANAGDLMKITDALHLDLDEVLTGQYQDDAADELDGSHAEKN